MRQWSQAGLIIVVTILMGLEFSARAQPAAPAAGGSVLSVLTRGQHVAIKETAAGFEINSFVGSGNFLGSEVVDVGNDFVVLRDLTGVTETRVPIYSVRAVITGRSSKR